LIALPIRRKDGCRVANWQGRRNEFTRLNLVLTTELFPERVGGVVRPVGSDAPETCSPATAFKP